MTSAAPDPADLLSDATHRLTRTVDGFHGDDWEAPSLLPGWTRAHVVAHLALNAEGMARVLRGLVADEAAGGPPAMYDSDENRDSDIVDLAREGATALRDRLLSATTELADAIASVPVSGWEGRVERTPRGRSMATASLPGMRLRELEIHHVDLDAGATTADWPPGFAEHLLDAMRRRDHDRSFEVRPLDLQRTWRFGSDETEGPVPVVTGPAADLGWWLTGRPAPETVSCSQGELPEIGAW